MAAVAKPKKIIKKASPDSKFRRIYDQVVEVPVDRLKPHPQNPNIGDIDAIAESLEENGIFRPIVVNRHRELNNVIAAGHHTWLAARRLGWDTIGVVYIDVDPERHLKIMLADNRTADRRTYDDALLNQILQGMKDIRGTGYTPADVEEIGARAAAMAGEAQQNLDDLMSSMPDSDFNENTEGKSKSAREEYLDESDDDLSESRAERGVARPVNPSEDDAEQIDGIQDVEVELQAVLELKEENFDHWKNSRDDYQIPELRRDMLLDQLPTPLQTWGGNEATPDDGKSWFLYNYSLGGLKGLPFDRTILCFYTYDEKFEGWWETPSWYTARVLAKGIKVAVVPDFSFYYTTPRVMHLWNVYRAQWIGRFFQEAGMKVIPRLQFDYKDPNTLEIALRGIPVGCPILATSQQNPEKEEDVAEISKRLQEALDYIKPKQLLYYSGPPGRRAMEKVAYSGEIFYLNNYVGVRRKVVFDKKSGLGALKKGDRQKVLNKARKRLRAKDDDSSSGKES